MSALASDSNSTGSDRLVVTGPRSLHGRVRVPGDKSISHRAVLLAALAEGTSTVRGLSLGEDVAHTRRAVEAMGARFVGDTVAGERIEGGPDRLHEPEAVLDVGNSGTGMRLLAGWCAARPWLSVLQGDRSIAARPMDRVARPLRMMGAHFDGRSSGRLPPLVIRGGDLRGITYTLPMASAQVKSAVLLAGLGAEGETAVHEPVATRAHTEEMLRACGADIEVGEGVVRVRRSVLRPFTLDVPGDPSAAAFWVVAACITPDSDVIVERVYVGRARAGFLDVLERMGADVEVTMLDATTADIRARTSELVGTEVGGDAVPGLIDEIPVLAVAAAAAKGTTTFADAHELVVKESDRVATTTAMLGALGARVEGRADGLVVHGTGVALHGAIVVSSGDHRIAMAAAVAGSAAQGETVVEGWAPVATSYPGFADELERVAR